LAQLPKLENSLGEILRIKDSFEKRYQREGGVADELREEEATESAFRREAPKHAWLHLATHGFFAPPEIRSALTSYERAPERTTLESMQYVAGADPALLSGIALTGASHQAKPGEDDGILTALEISEMDLSGVKLAVLSACETGLGQTAGGEGVLGLQRAFQVAGTKSVLTSLWRVDDEQTRQLMERFYANLWDKKKPMSKAQALREAQLWMLKEKPGRGLQRGDRKDASKPSRPLPKYWAPFVLSGDWR
jgi:CHAT domain-containing protein